VGAPATAVDDPNIDEEQETRASRANRSLATTIVDGACSENFALKLASWPTIERILGCSLSVGRSVGRKLSCKCLCCWNSCETMSGSVGMNLASSEELRNVSLAASRN
jgi:hypothetical protein